MSKKIKIYVAGPITKGDHMQNISKAIDAGHKLRDAGFYPYIPHLSCLWHLVKPREYEDWMEQDFVWLQECDALYRVSGESSGADREVAFAHENHIPVFFDGDYVRPDDNVFDPIGAVIDYFKAREA